jgi:peptide/nickel transport system permease protein
VPRPRNLPGNFKSGLALLLLLLAAALAAPLLATDSPLLGSDEDAMLRAPVPHDPNRIDLGAVLLPPERGHWMGTDALGRDLASRVIHGARVSLSVGLLAAFFALLVGVPLGALAGYRGGLADAAIARCIETILCFPTLLLALAVLATAPGWLREMSDMLRISLVLGLTGWIPVARYLRAEFMKLRNSDMVAAARAMGSGHLRIVSRHILPSAMAPVLITAAFAVGAAIGLEAALSFLGLGVRPPVATWGGLLSEAMEQVDSAWWLALFPGAALFLAVLGCNLLGEGIRDLLDPHTERRRT